MEIIDFWRKSYRVGAVRITKENIRSIAEELGGNYYIKASQIHYMDQFGSVGDWVVKNEKGAFELVPDEIFAGKFRTHSETMAEDEKYATVFQLVMSAMRSQDAATYHNESSKGMDLVATQITQQILWRVS